jgi:hypothetical protein
VNADALIQISFSLGLEPSVCVGLEPSDCEAFVSRCASRLHKSLRVVHEMLGIFGHHPKPPTTSFMTRSHLHLGSNVLPSTSMQVRTPELPRPECGRAIVGSTCEIWRLVRSAPQQIRPYRFLVAVKSTEARLNCGNFPSVRSRSNLRHNTQPGSALMQVNVGCERVAYLFMKYSVIYVSR